MISKKSFDPLLLNYKLGIWLKYSSVYLNEKEDRIVLLRDDETKKALYYFYKVFVIGSIVGRIGFVIGIILFLLFGKNVKVADVVVACFFLGFNFMSVPIHLLNYVHGDEIINQINVLRTLNKISGLFHLFLWFILKIGFICT